VKRSLIFLVALSWAASIGVVAVSQPPVAKSAITASPVVPVKDVEQAELIVKESPVPAGSFAEVSIKGVAAGDMVNYKVRPKPMKQVISNGVLYFNGLAQSYEVEATVINWDNRKWQVADAVVTFGTQPQPPPKPVDPVVPDVPVIAPPIDGDGFKVLIVYEAMDTTGLTRDQQSAIFGKSLRDFLNAKCVLGTDGKTREWRIWDKDVNTDSAPPQWAKAMKRERKSVPWIVVSNGKTGFEGPLPATEAAIMELLNKYTK